jgi:hypothetical protein
MNITMEGIRPRAYLWARSYPDSESERLSNFVLGAQSPGAISGPFKAVSRREDREQKTVARLRCRSHVRCRTCGGEWRGWRRIAGRSRSKLQGLSRCRPLPYSVSYCGHSRQQQQPLEDQCPFLKQSTCQLLPKPAFKRGISAESADINKAPRPNSNHLSCRT